MNPQSLLYVPSHLIAQGDLARHDSPHGERGERAVVYWVSLAAICAVVPLWLLLS